MDLSEALDRKEDFLRRYTSAHGEKEYGAATSSAIAQATASGGPADRLAIGVSSATPAQSRGASGSRFQLELRVQRADGPAFREAQKIKEQVHGEGRIRILPRIEFPSFSALLENMRSTLKFDDHKSPLQIGDPVRCRRAGSGTLGGFVKTNDGPGFLSSSHVIAAGAGDSDRTKGPSKGDPIYRPNKSALSIRSSSKIGNLTHWNYLDAADGNYIDAGFAEIDPEVEYTKNIIPSSADIPRRLRGKKLTALKAATYQEITAQFRRNDYDLIGKRVAKIGAASGYTQGIISGALIDGITAYVPWLGNVIYLNVFEIQPIDTTEFTIAGDSGSAIFTIDDTSVFGLHFAASDALDEEGNPLGFRVSYACSIQTIFDEFKDDGYAWMS